MGAVARFWDSSIGKKIVMALTGLVLVGFVLGHMAGNLQAFMGAEKLDAYGAMLHGPLAELLWLVRAVLLACVVLHVTAAVQLTLRNRAARPADYARRDPQASTFASRTLRLGGLILLAFIVFHILHFTTGHVHPDFREGAVYHNLVTGLQSPVVLGFYLLAMASLALHLYHGIWSSVRSLGVSRASGHPLKRRVALGLAVLIAGGFTAVPFGVLLGVLK